MPLDSRQLLRRIPRLCACLLAASSTTPSNPPVLCPHAASPHHCCPQMQGESSEQSPLSVQCTTVPPPRSVVRQGLEAEGREAVPVTLVELALVLHPVQAHRVQEGRQRLHHHQHAQRGARKHEEADDLYTRQTWGDESLLVSAKLRGGGEQRQQQQAHRQHRVSSRLNPHTAHTAPRGCTAAGRPGLGSQSLPSSRPPNAAAARPLQPVLCTPSFTPRFPSHLLPPAALPFPRPTPNPQ